MDLSFVLRSITIERLSRARCQIRIEEVRIPFFPFGLGLGLRAVAGLGSSNLYSDDSDDDDSIVWNRYLHNCYGPRRSGVSVREDPTGKPVPELRSNDVRTRHVRQLKSPPRSGPKDDFSFTGVVNGTLVSSTPFAQLKPTFIDKLKINIPAEGFYLILRTIEDPLETDELMTVVEDSQGKVINITVGHFFCCSLISPKDVVPLGTKLILKEPVCVLSKDYNYTLFSDTPTNVIVLQKHHPLFTLVENIDWCNRIKPALRNRPNPSTASEWESEGQILHTQGKNYEALEAFHLGVLAADITDVSVLESLNIGLANTYFALGHFETALVHSEKALKLNPTSKPALVASGRAEYQLQNYEEALEHFTLASEHFPDADLVKEIKFCNDRIEEANGDILMYKLYRISESKPNSPIAVADYQGPLEVVDIPGKGRGVVVNEDVQPGTLLIVSKAFACVFKKETEYTHHFGIDEAKYKVDPRLVQEVVKRVLRNPNTELTKLYELLPSEKRTHYFCDENTKEEPIVDVDMIKKIVRENQFVLEPYVKELGFIEGEVRGSGLFLFPSFLNHSCVPNANFSTFNDVLVVHAVREMKCGEEVTIAYVQPTVSYTEKKAHFAKFGFQCLCPMCKLDSLESEEELKVREDAVFEVEKNFPKYFGSESFRDAHSKMHARAELKHLIKKIQKTYRLTNRQDYKVALALPYICFFKFLYGKENKKLLLDYLWNALSALGFDHREMVKSVTEESELVIPTNAVLIPFTLFPIELVISCYQCLGYEIEKDKWVKVLSLLETRMNGANQVMIRSKFKLE